MGLNGDAMKKAVFLDRDGVINHVKLLENKPHPPSSLAELRYCDGAIEAIGNLLENKFLVVVVTNQPDIARKSTTQYAIDRIHARMRKDLGIQHFYICPHDDRDFCDCRKPKPGLLFKAASDLAIDLKKSYLVGDRWKDISAGQAAGCINFFINYNYSEVKPNVPYDEVSSLGEAVSIILESNE